MSTKTEVDTAPEEVGENNVGSPENATDISRAELASLFSEPIETAVDEVEETDSSESEVEKPAVDLESETEPEEDSSLTEDEAEDSEPVEVTDEVVEEESEEEEEEEEPPWFRKRIDKITAQRKEAEEKITALEEKLAEKEAKETPASTIEQVRDIPQLEILEKQAIEAEDQVDELLEAEPKYDDDGEAYWQVGEDKLTRKQLIDIRKNARNAFRAVPARKEFLQKKAVADEQASKISFFTDSEDPYYSMAQELLKSPIYEKLESEIPDAKVAVALMIEGKRSLDSRESQKAKAAKKVNRIKPAPTSKAATDTGTVAPTVTPETAMRKKLDKDKKNPAGMSKNKLAEYFSK